MKKKTVPISQTPGNVGNITCEAIAVGLPQPHLARATMVMMVTMMRAVTMARNNQVLVSQRQEEPSLPRPLFQPSSKAVIAPLRVLLQQSLSPDKISI